VNQRSAIAPLDGMPEHSLQPCFGYLQDSVQSWTRTSSRRDITVSVPTDLVTRIVWRRVPGTPDRLPQIGAKARKAQAGVGGRGLVQPAH
jgi:hypothetical protein